MTADCNWSKLTGYPAFLATEKERAARKENKGAKGAAKGAAQIFKKGNWENGSATNFQRCFHS